MDDGIDRYLRIVGSMIAFREKTNGVIVEWNFGYSLNVADCKSVGISRWFGEVWGPETSPRVYRGLSRAELLSSQVNWWTGRPEFGRHPHQVREGIRFHFLHDLPAVCLYRDFADSELAANLFIQQP